MVTGATQTARAPMEAPRPTTTPTGCQSPARFGVPSGAMARGKWSFVKTAAGPTKTPSRASPAHRAVRSSGVCNGRPAAPRDRRTHLAQWCSAVQRVRPHGSVPGARPSFPRPTWHRSQRPRWTRPGRNAGARDPAVRSPCVDGEGDQDRPARMSLELLGQVNQIGRRHGRNTHMGDHRVRSPFAALGAAEQHLVHLLPRSQAGEDDLDVLARLRRSAAAPRRGCCTGSPMSRTRTSPAAPTAPAWITSWQASGMVMK